MLCQRRIKCCVIPTLFFHKSISSPFPPLHLMPVYMYIHTYTYIRVCFLLPLNLFVEVHDSSSLERSCTTSLHNSASTRSLHTCKRTHDTQHPVLNRHFITHELIHSVPDRKQPPLTACSNDIPSNKKPPLWPPSARQH
uniref:Uncharacterized protein n=1 Tax=Trypanosoma vivax (strain Y486) TaxID=1055687 RepID=G0TS75_TRYVY|nr:hypothetical protein, unlikely [Trypanosoma vivax Y486]